MVQIRLDEMITQLKLYETETNLNQGTTGKIGSIRQIIYLLRTTANELRSLEKGLFMGVYDKDNG